MAKAIALSLNIKLIGVNHLIGHIYSLFIEKETQFPCTVLLVSGGHTQVMEVKNLQDIKTVAKSMDHSFGESFDKVAKMMGLGYPGGPLIQELAKDGDRKKYKFTVPLHQSPLIAFSYSGLKNAVRLAILEAEDKNEYKDIAASFEHIATAHLVMKLKKYFKISKPITFAIVGGASANLYLRSQIETLLKPHNAQLLLSELKYCSDNAAMIGRVAIQMYEQNMFTSIDKLQSSPRSSL
jgi:N6-L-threonylcarbamoyladenine synthase